MVRKRKKVVRNEEKKEKKVHVPDPNSEDFMYDEVDKFHRNKDKIYLDPNHKDLEESDQSDLDEEVLGLESDTDENEEEEDENDDEDGSNDDENDESGDEEDEDEEKGIPSDQAWGKSKKQFYHTDVDDADIYASDEEGELAAQEEEVEAMTLQKRMAARLDEEDFFDVQEDEKDDEKPEEKTTVKKDLSKMSKREKLQLLNKQSPDLLPLINEYQECLNELKTYYNPLMKLTEEDDLSTMSEKCKLFIQTRHKLLMNYLVNISFYLALKAKQEELKGHPIVDVLFRHREMLSQTKELHEKLVLEFERLLESVGQEEDDDESDESADEDEKVESDSADEQKTPENTKSKTMKKNTVETAKKISSVDSTTKKSKKKTKKKQPKNGPEFESDESDVENAVDPLDYYNSIKADIERKKLAKKQSGMATLGEDEEEEVVGFGEDGKRMITYEMSKNKGLVRQRRKELKNPRVKHKMKYKKAKVKHKSVVREVRNEQNRYGGEVTGIKATLSRSVRIK